MGKGTARGAAPNAGQGTGSRSRRLRHLSRLAGLGPEQAACGGRIPTDPSLGGIIKLHTGVPSSNKVVKYDSLECRTVSNRSSLSVASVPICCTIVR